MAIQIHRCLILLVTVFLGATVADAFITNIFNNRPSLLNNVALRTSSIIFSSTSSNENGRMSLCKGSYVAIITPMLPSGAIDVDSLRSLLRFHVENKTDGLCILGTTGEASSMTMAERESVLKVAVEEVKGKLPILVGTGTINPNHVKEQTLQAIDLGCDACLVVTPYYVKPPQRGIIKHYTSIADLGLPTVLYNVPGRTAVDLFPESVAICAEHENIVGVKEATGNVDRVEQIRNLCGEDFLLLSGDDKTEADFVLKGGDGCISVTANLAPQAMHDMMAAALRGDADEAHRIDDSLTMLHSNIFIESSPMPAKWAAKRIGLIANDFCRPPLDVLEKKNYGAVEEAMKAAGLI